MFADRTDGDQRALCSGRPGILESYSLEWKSRSSTWYYVTLDETSDTLNLEFTSLLNVDDNSNFSMELL